ncbi:MAG: M48 family metalloprotease [Reinekea forsetii]|nr:M48 family metalloprotease [Reinekea forsetii]
MPLLVLTACNTMPTDGDFRARASDLLKTADNAADVDAEIRFGREVAARYLGVVDAVDNNELQRYVSTLGGYLAQYSGRSELVFHFRVVDSPTINAYAMPGGYIFLTSGTLALMRNEAELAGVLAHEIAHVREKHIVRALNIRGLGSGATLSQLASGASDAFRVALDQATDAALGILQADGLQQDDEFSADEIGLFIMVQAGYNPDAYSEFLARVSQAAGSDRAQMSQTHPSFVDRLDKIEVIKITHGLNDLDYALLVNRFKAFNP